MGVIRDLDATVIAWLSALAPRAAVSMDLPPVPGRTAGTARPTLSLRLVRVEEDQAAGTHSWTSQRSEEGRVVGRVPPDRRYRFTYLVTASAADTLSEHELLGTVLTGLALEDVVPDDHLRGVMGDCSRALTVRCAPEHEDSGAHSRWPAWDLTGQTCLELTVLAPLPTRALAEVAEPPSEIALQSSRSSRPRSETGPALDPTPRRITGRISED